MRGLRNTGGGLILLTAVVVLAGCSGGGAGRVETGSTANPMVGVRNAELPLADRVAALGQAWQEVELGLADRAERREQFKVLVWSDAWPIELRLEALRLLLADTDDAGRADSRQLVRLRLPSETDLRMIRQLSEAAAENGWVEATPALVRSLSRQAEHVPDEQRPEWSALMALHPGESVESVVFDLLVSSSADGSALAAGPDGASMDAHWARRAEADAWELLSRRDPQGERMTELVRRAPEGTSSLVADLQAGLHELRVVPVRGEELIWLRALRRPEEPHRSWWAEVRSVVEQLDATRTGPLQLRHLEPVRWAARHRPEWLGRTREALLDELRARLASRRNHRPQAVEGSGVGPLPETLAAAEPRLAWGDVLAMLVIDEALQDPALPDALFAQARLDQADRTTEYGGLLAWRAAGDGVERAVVELYPPRPASRLGDRRFVASADMIRNADHALAHYHFHAQRWTNAEYAGPSQADLDYARRYGRMCVVLTAVRSDTLGVDVYTPRGVVVDLGEVRAVSRPR